MLLNSNKLFEYSYFDGNFYGMPWSEVENAYSKLTVFNVGIDAAKKLKEHDSNITTILVVPPTKEDLLTRIGDRGVERYNRARDDLNFAASFFDNLVINGTNQVEQAVVDIENIIFDESKEYSIENFTAFLENYFEKNKSKIYRK